MFFQSKVQLSAAARRIRWGFLGATATPLGGAFLYNQGYQIPFLGCPIRHLTGIPCPTCGMTRSFMAIARGDLHQAVAYHLFSPLVFLFFVVAAIHLALELRLQRQIHPIYIQLIRNCRLQISTLLIFLGYYAIRLYFLAQSGELYPAMVRSPLGQLLF